MKIGDLVKSKTITGKPRKAGLIIDLIEKKCWRTHILGKAVDWSKIDPEPHAIVLIEGRKLTIPLTDLELIDNSLTT
jgi:hypothetical protein